MDAIILAGGQGKRLRPLTDNLPKCMVPINGKPMLQYQIDWLKRNGIQKIVIAAGYKWEKIKEVYGDKLIYSIEKTPLGTGGALKQALQHVDSDEFLLVNCDDLTDINVKDLQKVGSNCIVLSRFNSPFGIVETEKEYVKAFRQKPLLDHWAWTGIALLNKKLNLPDKGSFETELFESKKFKLKAYKHTGYWITVNTEKDLEEAESVFKK